MDALQLSTGLHIEHVAATKQFFRTRSIQNRRRVIAVGDLEADTRRAVSFNHRRDNISTRTLCGDNHVHAGRSGFLGQAHDLSLYFLAVNHQQVSQLVDDDNDVRDLFQRNRRLGMRIHNRSTGFLRFANSLVVTVKVFLSGHLQQFVASIHFADGPGQTMSRLGHIRNHRGQKMGNIFVGTEFHFLRINQNQLELIRRILIQHRQNHGVDTDGLTGTRSTGDQ